VGPKAAFASCAGGAGGAGLTYPGRKRGGIPPFLERRVRRPAFLDPRRRRPPGWTDDCSAIAVAGAGAGEAAGVEGPKKSGSFGRLNEGNEEKKDPDFFSGAAV